MNLSKPLDPALLESLFGLFRLSRMVYAAATLGIAEHLSDAPLGSDELARRAGAHGPALRSLMDALVGWGVFDRTDTGSYALNPLSRRLVSGSENAASIPLLLGWVGLPATYDAFGGLVDTVRTGQSAFATLYGQSFYEYLETHPESAALYESAMESTTASFERSAEAYAFPETGLLVDVGGGQGAFALEILKRHPGLSAIVFDLPQVVSGHLRDGRTPPPRVEFVGGNAFESVPEGGDVYVTSTVLRCFEDGDCVRILTNIRRAMGPQSKLVAFEMLMPEARDHAAMCTADLLARVLYGGRDRTKEEFAGLFASAGLRLEATVQIADTLHAVEGLPV